jgi:hypothetical protein
LERVIYMNCDPFDATEKDAAIIREIAERQSALEAARKQG